MMGQREQSEMDFRQKMFTALLEKLFQGRASVRERVTTLRIFQQNFHETLNSRALFEGMYEEALTKKDEEASKDIIALDQVGLRNGGIHSGTEHSSQVP